MIFKSQDKMHTHTHTHTYIYIYTHTHTHTHIHTYIHMYLKFVRSQALDDAQGYLVMTEICSMYWRDIKFVVVDGLRLFLIWHTTARWNIQLLHKIILACFNPSTCNDAAEAE